MAGKKKTTRKKVAKKKTVTKVETPKISKTKERLMSNGPLSSPPGTNARRCTEEEYITRASKALHKDMSDLRGEAELVSGDRKRGYNWLDSHPMREKILEDVEQLAKWHHDADDDLVLTWKGLGRLLIARFELSVQVEAVRRVLHDYYGRDLLRDD